MRASLAGVLIAAAVHAGAANAQTPAEQGPAAPAVAQTPADLPAAAPAAARLDPSAVRFAAPPADSFVSGPTQLRAVVDEALTVDSVIFFADGRQVCAVAAAPFDCEWDAGQNVVAHQMRLVVTLTSGERIIRTLRTRSLGFADKVNVEVVQVTVTVTDDHGRFVSGIPRSAFRVFEDGKPQAITYFASADVPLELIVAVDISGSMTPSMPKLKKAVKDFLSAVPSKDQVTLLGFNDNVFALTRKTTDPAERSRAVDRLAPWGATALYDVILRGIDMLGRQTGRKAFVVFTDGEDQGSHVTIEEVERKLQASDVTLYMIGQGRGLSQDYLKKVMHRLTVPTGGRVFTTDSVDELHGAFEELLDELSNQYLLGYPPTNTKRDDTWREIRVEVDGHKGVRARQGYRATPYK
ncbi:MAG TPA: VWA domain-containing protein [Vicinamibacterales bacterium]|jgi:VWFA-related protein